jgi:hypothetical protein
VKGSNPRAVLAADMELGAGNVLLRLAEHGADMDMPRVTFDTDVDANPAWTPLSLRTLTQRTAARAEWFARHGIGRRDPVAVSLPGSRFNDTLGSIEMGYGGFGISHRPGTERYGRCVGKPQPFAEIILVDQQTRPGGAGRRGRYGRHEFADVPHAPAAAGQH